MVDTSKILKKSFFCPIYAKQKAIFNQYPIKIVSVDVSGPLRVSKQVECSPRVSPPLPDILGRWPEGAHWYRK